MDDFVLSYRTKQDLLDALEARRPTLVDYDKRRLVQHKADEKAALKDFRDRCREALRAPYAEAKKQYVYSNNLRLNQPTCPRSLVVQLDHAIKVLQTTGQKQFTISRRGRWSDVYHLLTVDIDAVVEMC